MRYAAKHSLKQVDADKTAPESMRHRAKQWRDARHADPSREWAAAHDFGVDPEVAIGMLHEMSHNVGVSG